jgi:hypothetical protein
VKSKKYSRSDLFSPKFNLWVAWWIEVCIMNEFLKREALHA